MINREMRNTDVFIKVKSKSKYGELVESWDRVGTIQMAFSFVNMFEKVVDTRYVETTHYGYTRDKSLTMDSMIRCGGIYYRILMVNNQSKLSQLYLQEISEVVVNE